MSSAKKQRSVLRGWAASYALLLILPLTMALVNHMYAYTTMREAVEIAHTALNDCLRISFDQRVEQLKYTYTNAYLSEEYAALRAANGYPTLLSASYNMQKMLSRDATVHADSRMSTIIYLSEFEHIITEAHAYTSEGVYGVLNEMHGNGQSLTQQEWRALLSIDTDKMAFSFSPYLGYSTYGTDCIVLSKRLPWRSGYIYCHFSIAMDKELEQIAAMQPDSLFCIVDADGKTLLGAWNARGERIKAQEIVLEDGLAWLAGDEYVAVRTDSQQLNWSFITLTPDSAFATNLVQLNRFDLSTLLLTVLGCAVLTITFLRRNYLPLARILGAIGAEPVVGNEYERILSAYRARCRENSSLRTVLSQSDSYAREKYLLSRLLGRDNRFVDWQVERRVEDFFRDRMLQMLVVRAVNAAARTSFDAVQRKIHALFAPLIQDDYDVQPVVDGDLIVYLCVEKEEHSGEIRPLTDIARALSAVASEPLILVLGGKCALADCDKTYSEVVDVVNCLHAAGETGVFRACDLLDANASLRKGRRIAESRLREAILAGDAAAAAISLNMLYEAISQKSSLSFQMTRFFYLDVLRQIGNAIDEALENEDSVRERARMRMGDIAMCASQEEMEASIRAFATQMCEAVIDARASLSRGTAAHAREYIDTAYADPNLNLSAVALHLRLSPQTVTQYFRAEMNMSVPDYIAHVRIVHARALAREKAMSIEEIAYAVGYGNTRTFHRACVRLKGAPPGKVLYPERD